MSSVVILINNYNYEDFIGDSVKSALFQTYKRKRVCVIDDGSTDKSLQVLRQLKTEHPELEIYEKENAGQLSVFNAGVDVIGDSEWVFLLDADDVYSLDHVEQVLKRASEETSMILVDVQPFSGVLPLEKNPSQKCDEAVIINVPKSAHITRSLGKAIGRQTSALALRNNLYRKIFPYQPESDWIISADQVICRSASILGAHKRFIKNIAINYRIHENNRWHKSGKKINRKNRRIAVKRVHASMQRKSTEKPLPRNAGVFPYRALLEILSVPRQYRKLVGIPSVTYFIMSVIFSPIRKRKY